MIEYIYFVKCPNCEDEHFDFFDEAKAFALGCLSQKPIITQIEVCRNDFGECTDHSDLGTIWSWEDECKESGPDAEIAGSHVLTKADLENVPECDPEFDELDNSVEPNDDFFFLNNNLSEDAERRIAFKGTAEIDEFTKLCKEIGIITMKDIERFMKETGANAGNLLAKLREYRAELGDDFEIEESRKPIPAGMTIKQLVEEMEENEDEVECTWCNDLFPKDQCRKEVNLGYLCSRCEAAIKSRGEKLTFIENDYWDFLDEEVEIPADSDEEESEESIFDEAKSIEDVVGILVKDEEEAITAYEEAQDKVDEFLEGEDAEVANEVLEHIKEEEIEHIEELESILAESDEDETSEISEEELIEENLDTKDKQSARMGTCPECGVESVFDYESGVCNNCGFIL